MSDDPSGEPAPATGQREATAGGVTFSGVGVTYRTTGVATPAIRCLDGAIRPGSFTAIVGPSGCGKSTLLDLVGGLLHPTSGSVSVDGVVVDSPRADTAMVFQEDSTLHWRTVVDNVAFGLEVRRMPKSERRQRARQLVERVGLGGFEDHRPRELSGGMRQRVAIARALALQPKLLLMDEPFGALDQQTRRLLGDELVTLWEQSGQQTVLFVTHDIHEAVYLADEVWVLSARPSVMIDRVTVEVPRPREPTSVHTPAFQEHVRRIWDVVRDESMRSMPPASAPAP